MGMGRWRSPLLGGLHGAWGTARAHTRQHQLIIRQVQAAAILLSRRQQGGSGGGAPLAPQASQRLSAHACQCTRQLSLQGRMEERGQRHASVLQQQGLLGAGAC